MSALQLEVAADLLGPILEDVVFIGGATVHLWLTEAGAPPARPTEDVDVEFPRVTPTRFVNAHCWHLACEFSNWIEAANAA
jgi:hypothetical protein